MMRIAPPTLLTLLIAFGAATSAVAKLTPEQVQALPPATSIQVDFVRDIQPMLEAACLKCHGRGKARGGFSLETRETFLKGSDSGPVAIEGKGAESLLIEVVSGLNPDNVMPQKGTKLTPAQVGLLRAWVDQGMPWEPGVSFAKQEPHNLRPRSVPLPPMDPGASEHPIDRLLQSHLKQHLAMPLPKVDDRTFARRTHMDLLGTLPSPESVDAFQADTRGDKRAQWVNRLLSDRQGYAAHWFSFWNDLLRNDYRGTGYIDQGRKQISSWLHSALATNMSYHQFVRLLVDPTPETEGFSKGIVWRGAINASQTPPMQAAQNISQVFMGVNLKCASCHDSFINDWSLADAYGLASVYADEPLELVECDKPTGRKAVVRFIYPQLGDFEDGLKKSQRTARLAELMTSRENGRLSRTLVNRLWERLMGHGLVAQVDDMDQRAWNPDLLDWLAEDFVANGHDVQRVLRWIVTSQAYQLPAVDLGENPGSGYVFKGPAIRRMSAEQFRDALGTLTGVWHSNAAADFDLATGGDPEVQEKARVPASARWIWSKPGAQTNAPAGDLFLRKTFTLTAPVSNAAIVALADNSYTLHVNGKQVLAGKGSDRAQFADLKPHLRQGENLIAIQANNAENSAEKKADPNPAGVLVYARIQAEGREIEVVTDPTWTYRTQNPADWKQLDFGASGWKPASEVASVGGGDPWNGQVLLTRALSLAAMHGHIRSSLVPSDPLMTALGRPPREQLVTVRTSLATTLQALEFSNGETLAALLKDGAAQWLGRHPSSGRDLFNEVFRRGLGRGPTDREMELAGTLFTPPIQKEQVEDLLWAVAMLPEFQLIH